jgi:ectoine hydroxylase-related dioxygenase (phytanoyl-CoA dioxygenase family)
MLNARRNRRMGEPVRLDVDQVEAFYEQGWFVLPDLFGPAEIATARAAFERLYQTAQMLRDTQMHRGAYFVLDAPADRDVVVKRVVWAGGAERDLLTLSADPRLVAPALQLLGSQQCEQLLCQAHFKMPHDGVAFDWHQDIQHRDKGPGTWADLNGRGSYVQTILLIDDMTQSNGPLQFIPGTDRAPASPAMTDPNAAVTITGAAGSVLVFGPYSIHGSTANAADAPRRVLINGYAFPGANGRAYPGDGAGRVLPLPL